MRHNDGDDVSNPTLVTRFRWVHGGCIIAYNNGMYKTAMEYYYTGACNNPIKKAAIEECMAVVHPNYYGVDADKTGCALYFILKILHNFMLMEQKNFGFISR